MAAMATNATMMMYSVIPWPAMRRRACLIIWMSPLDSHRPLPGAAIAPQDSPEVRHQNSAFSRILEPLRRISTNAAEMARLL
jgi:hypothetical protein